MFSDPLPLQLLWKNNFCSIFWNGVDLPPSYVGNVFKYTVFFFDVTPSEIYLANDETKLKQETNYFCPEFFFDKTTTPNPWDQINFDLLQKLLLTTVIFSEASLKPCLHIAL